MRPPGSSDSAGGFDSASTKQPDFKPFGSYKAGGGSGPGAVKTIGRRGGGGGPASGGGSALLRTLSNSSNPAAFGRRGAENKPPLPLQTVA